MQTTSLKLMFATCVLVAAASGAAGQEAGVRTGLAIVPGAAFASADIGPSVGGAITVDLSSRVAMEINGTFADRGTGADALSVQAGLLANLISGDVRVQPFIAAGGGIYRASFDLAAQRFLGGMGGQFGPGMTACGGTGVCPYGSVPLFYGRRLGSMTAPGGDGPWATRTFTDPAFHLGGGVRINATPHVFIRPELRGLFVMADSDVQSLGTVSVGFGYRF
jgi:hypothetical protein